MFIETYRAFLVVGSPKVETYSPNRSGRNCRVRSNDC